MGFNDCLALILAPTLGIGGIQRQATGQQLVTNMLLRIN